LDVAAFDGGPAARVGGTVPDFETGDVGDYKGEEAEVAVGCGVC
jgi:hypothetical protein